MGQLESQLCTRPCSVPCIPAAIFRESLSTREQQQVLQTQNYRYQPQDAVVQQHYQTRRSACKVPLRPRPPHRLSAGNRRKRAAKRSEARNGPSAPSAGRSPVQRAGASGAATTTSRSRAFDTAAAAGRSPTSGAATTTSRSRAFDTAAAEGRSPTSGAQPSQGAAQHEQQGPRSQGVEHGPKGKESVEQTSRARSRP